MIAHHDLAINGGPQAVPSGPPTWPLNDEDIKQALVDVYQSGDWGRYHGVRVDQLQRSLADMHGISHVMACCSGTIAVELALRALKVDRGDEVVLAGYDFGGNFRAIEAVGALPVLADIDPRTWTMSAESIAAAIGPKVRAVIVSHLHGGTAPMPAIRTLADEHGIFVVEDACQMHGADVFGKPAGTWGDVGVLSFGGSKLLTSGRGGAILTERADVFQRAKIFCERGNHAFALSELQAAVLLPQLERLSQRNTTRYENVLRLLAAVGQWPGFQSLEFATPRGCPSFYKLAWLFDSTHFHGTTRDRFIAAVQAEGIAIDAGFRGFLKRSSRRCRKSVDLANCLRAAEQTVLLHHPVLLEGRDRIEEVAGGICKVLECYSASEK